MYSYRHPNKQKTHAWSTGPSRGYQLPTTTRGQACKQVGVLKGRAANVCVVYPCVWRVVCGGGVWRVVRGACRCVVCGVWCVVCGVWRVAYDTHERSGPPTGEHCPGDYGATWSTTPTFLAVITGQRASPNRQRIFVCGSLIPPSGAFLPQFEKITIESFLIDDCCGEFRRAVQFSFHLATLSRISSERVNRPSSKLLMNLISSPLI